MRWGRAVTLVVVSACGVDLDALRARDGGPPADAGGDVSLDAAACGDTRADPHNCGACGHDCCGGDCLDGACQPRVLATMQTKPGTIVADETHVYWQQSYNGAGMPSSGDVMRVRLDGTNLEVFVRGRSIFNGIQGDANQLIWEEFPPPRLATASKTATIDPDAGAPITTYPAVDPKASAGFISGFLVDGPTLYWWASSTTECPGFIARCLYSAPTNDIGHYKVFLGSYSGNISPRATDADFLYAWSNTFQVYRLNKRDGGTEPLFMANRVAFEAVDDTYIYWSDPTVASIYKRVKIPVDAGAETFATLQNVPTSIILAGTDLYWGNVDGIVTCPTSGCPAGLDKPRLVVAEHGITDFTLTSKCFFYLQRDSGTVKVIGR